MSNNKDFSAMPNRQLWNIYCAGFVRGTGPDRAKAECELWSRLENAGPARDWPANTSVIFEKDGYLAMGLIPPTGSVCPLVALLVEGGN